MHCLPHTYSVTVIRSPHGLAVGAPPRELIAGGTYDARQGDWTPEHLLVGSVALCFQGTLERLARERRADIRHLRCHATGAVERTPEGSRFVRVRVHVHLTVPPGRVIDGEQLVVDAMHGCLISHSLRCPVEIDSQVRARELNAAELS
jgi:organic hydroperoxide reductase OsmC/OhrA